MPYFGEFFGGELQTSPVGLYGGRYSYFDGTTPFFGFYYAPIIVPPVPKPKPRTARDLISRALRLAGCYGSGEQIDAADASDALLALNQMLDTWSTDSLMVFQNREEVFSLAAGVASYTMGPGGDFDTDRPIEVNYAFCRDSYGIDRGISIVDQQVFANISLKSIGNIYPEVVWSTRGYPLTTLTFYPVPSDGLTLHIGMQQILSGYANLSDEVNLPPGYEEALICSLAEIIAPEYGRQCPPTVSQRGASARGRIRGANLPTDTSVTIEFASAGPGDGRAAFFGGY